MSVSFVERTVWWVKRDFRVTDNHCLYQATQSSDEVIPFFCWEPSMLEADDFGSFHLQAQWQALNGLSASLQKRDSGIRVRTGEVVDELELLLRIYPFQRIRSYQETGNDLSFRRDLAVRAWCKARGVDWVESVGNTVVRGMSVAEKRQAIGKGPRGRLAIFPIPKNICPPREKVLFSPPTKWKDLLTQFSKFSAPLSASVQMVNERSSWDTLNSFLQDRGRGYSGGISSPNTAFTSGSRLSPHLAWGTISLASVFDALDQRREELSDQKGRNPWRQSLRAFESRLHWRDHFIQRLEGSPGMEFCSLNPAYDSIEYDDDSGHLAAWISGQTGYPMVDACMRCLSETGFMNFRMRAMVVSFACFGLHLSWKKIHGPLARIFLDYEPGIHLSQLQMQAGITGINAIRVYSPSKQFLDHDAQGEFVKRWVPELRDYTPVEIAHAEELSIKQYPSPIVSLKDRAREMKEQIFMIRKSETGKEFAQKTLRMHGSRKGSKKGGKPRSLTKGQLALFKD